MSDEEIKRVIAHSVNEVKQNQEEEDLGKWFSCAKCTSIIKIPLTKLEPNRCPCGSAEFKFIRQEIYTKTQYEEAVKRFNDEDLLNLVWKELSKNHIGDDNLKLTTFITCVSSLLNNPKRRMSLALTGNSSEGKDNCSKTSLNHMPRDSFIFLTSGTQSTIEDDIKDKRIIAFSEVNASRESGANKFLIEVIKQKTEGGTSSIKKDIRTGMKSARHEKGEQATVIYGTTELSMDEEMGTRFIRGTIETDPVRIKKVNDKTLDTFADLDLLMEDSKQEDSWIRIGLSHFFCNKKPLEVQIPYAEYLKEKVNGNWLFDHNNPRSQRDIKRVLALTCAMTFLFQEQREIVEHKGQKVLVSQPEDFLNVLKISSQFFNQSYSGLDKRQSRVLEIMNGFGIGWIARDDIEKSMGVTRNTVKQYCATLADEGLIEGCSGKSLNELEALKIYNGNKIYYKRCQKGVKKPLIRCEINELKSFLETKLNKKIDTFEEVYTKKGVNNKGVKKTPVLKYPFISEIDTFKLTPLKKNFHPIMDTSPRLTLKDFLDAGYSGQEAKEYIEDSEGTIQLKEEKI